MSLEQIEQSLPNGLHDTQIKKMHFDFELQEFLLHVDVLVGLPGEDRDKRSLYKTGELRFSGLHFCSIDPPAMNSSFRHAGPVWFGYERMAPSVQSRYLIDSDGSDLLAYSFFVQDWLSHIHVIVGGVAFAWLPANIYEGMPETR